MTKKRDKKFISMVFLYIGLFTLMFLIFPRKLEKDMYFQAVRVNSVSIQKSIPSESMYPFKLGRHLGYLNGDGEPNHSIPVKKNFSISSIGYFNYDQTDSEIPFFNPQGEHSFLFRGKGFPFLVGNRILSVHGQGGSLSEYGLEGQLLWQKDFSGILTSIKSKGEQLVAGFSNGEFHLLDSHGRKEYSFAPGGSRLPIILGVDFGYKTNSIVTVSGIDPQRVIMYEKNKEKFRPIYHYDLESSFRREVYISYSRNEKWVFIENDNKMDILNAENKEVNSIEYPGEIVLAECLDQEEMFYLLTVQKNLVHIKYYSKFFDLVMEFSFPAKHFFLLQNELDFHWGIDDKFISTKWTRG